MHLLRQPGPNCLSSLLFACCLIVKPPFCHEVSFWLLQPSRRFPYSDLPHRKSSRKPGVASKRNIQNSSDSHSLFFTLLRPRPCWFLIWLPSSPLLLEAFEVANNMLFDAIGEQHREVWFAECTQYTAISSVQFSRSVVSDSLQHHELQHARPPCPSPTPGFHSDSRPSSQWCHPAISSSVIPFSSCPQSLPASESLPMSQLFAWGGQSTGVSALASFLPKNTQDWSPLEWIAIFNSILALQQFVGIWHKRQRSVLI